MSTTEIIGNIGPRVGIKRFVLSQPYTFNNVIAIGQQI